MATLKVLLEGRELYNINFAKGRQYSIGRAGDSDVVLNKSSISRQHMRIFFNGEHWQIELLTKYGHFSHLGEDINQLILSSTQTFFIEGYEFRYVEEEPQKSVEPSKTLVVPQTTPDNNEDNHAIDMSREEALAPNSHESLGPDTQTGPGAVPEKTAIATRLATPSIHATDEDSGEELLFSLEGNHWVAGRSKTCQIRVSEKKSSRQHFEIYRTPSGFEVMDLGSSNGTLLNGKRLPANVRTTLNLGDKIQVGKTIFAFQMRYNEFEKDLASIPQNLFDDEVPLSPLVIESSPFSHQGPAVIKYESEHGGDRKKAMYFRGAIGLILLVVIYFGIQTSDKGEETNPSKGPLVLEKQSTFDQLTSEQRKLAETTYQLAKNFYIQQKYQMSKSEIEKLHAIVPFFKDSREMEKYIEQAIQIENDRERFRIEQEKQKVVATQVRSITKECEGKITPTTTVAQIQNCLQLATEMDPENLQIQNLINRVTATEDQRKQSLLEKENRALLIKRNQNIYSDAQRAEAKGDYLRALDIYNKLLSSQLPDPNGNKTKARENIAHLHSKIKAGVSQLLAKASQLRSQEQYREAYKALAQAMRLDPSDSRILTTMAETENELKKKMRALYNDGVLEENIGNLESAKQKWRVIRDQDLENGEYHKKATSKLKRYGD